MQPTACVWEGRVDTIRAIDGGLRFPRPSWFAALSQILPEARAGQSMPSKK